MYNLNKVKNIDINFMTEFKTTETTAEAPTDVVVSNGTVDQLGG